jgi:2-dehydropantoate 2-reductase
MKIGIVGAGAIGGWMGARLAHSGAEVSVVARGATLQALRLHGLRLNERAETLSAPVRASSDPAELGVQDLVVVAVKAPSLPEVAGLLAPMLGPHTVVLTAMNGVPWWFLQGFGGALANTRLMSVDADGALAKAIPGAHVVGCVVHASCSIEAPGLIHHHLGNRLLSFP